MIEPISLVTVLGFLAKKAFGKTAEEAGKAGASALIDLFRTKVEHSSAKHEARDVTDALATLKANPDDAEAQEDLKVYLRKALKTDPHLAAQLQQWLEEAQSHGPGGGGGIHQVANASNGGVVAQVSGSHNSIKVGK
jgi:hypothetical protein